MAGERVHVRFLADAHFAGDVDGGAAQRVFARLGRPLGEGRAVPGEDRCPLRKLDLAFEVLALQQTGKDEARVPGDAAVFEGKAQLRGDGAEGHGVDSHLHGHDGRPVDRAGIPRRVRVE